MRILSRSESMSTRILKINLDTSQVLIYSPLTDMKIIIKNDTKLSACDAVQRILIVMSGGLISKTSRGKQYCFITTFGDCVVYADKLKSDTHVFRVGRLTV